MTAVSGNTPAAPLATSASLAVAHGLPFTYMTLDAVMQATGKSKSTIYAEIAAAAFPEPDRHGGRSLWRSTSIAEYLTRQAATADGERDARAAATKERAQRMVAGRKRKGGTP